MIYAAAALAAVALWGGSGIAHGIKWTWHEKSCIVHHGVKYCRAQSKTPAPVVVPAPGLTWDNSVNTVTTGVKP